MEDALHDIIRWSIGFCIVSAIYLVVARYLVRRYENYRATAKTSPTTGTTASPDSAPQKVD